MPEKPIVSRTQQAVEWLKKNPGKTKADAAREFGISWQVINRAQKQDAKRCECCGQVIRTTHVKK